MQDKQDGPSQRDGVCPPSPTFDPCQLDIPLLAQSGQTLYGIARATQMQRVPVPASWSAKAECLADPGQYRLHIQAQASIEVECQRCLQAMRLPLQVVRDFLLVQAAATADTLDAQETIDVLVLSPGFDLLALVEDELILETPFAPMHTHCPQALVPDAEPGTQIQTNTHTAETPKPFAVLSQLKHP